MNVMMRRRPAFAMRFQLGRLQTPRAAAAAALLSLASCTGPSYVDARLYPPQYLPTPPAEDRSRTLEWRQIQFWAKDPFQKETVGYLETREVTLAGVLDPTVQYHVYARNQKSPFAYINDVGVTHIWRHGGVRGESYWQRIGEYSLEDAMKVLFKRGTKTNVGFEPMEWTPRLD